MDIRLKDVPGYIIICVVAVAGLLLFGTVKLLTYAIDSKSDFEKATGYRDIDEMIAANSDFLAQIENQLRAMDISQGDRTKAEAGDRDAQYRLGNFYLYGDGIRRPDYKEAMNWFSKSAAQVYAPAEYQVGRIHANGHGVSENRKEATNWYLKSANGGYKWAQIHLGEIYLHFLAEKFGVERNFSEAYFWLSLGTAGDNDAQDDFVRDREDAKHRLTDVEIDVVEKRLNEWRKTHASVK